MSNALISKIIVIGGAIATMIAALGALITKLPERRKTIVSTQIEVIENLWKENARQAQLIAELEIEVAELRKRVGLFP